MGPEDGEDRPNLRVVEDGELPPAPRRSWRPVGLIALAIVLVAAAVTVGIVVGRHGSTPAQDPARHASGATAGSSTTLGYSALPTIAPVSTVTAPGSASTGTAATAAGAGPPSLVPLPVAGSTGGVGPPPAASPTTAAPPTTGSVRVRLFNGFTPGQSLQVWEVSSTPVLYGTLPYGGYAQVDAHGELLNAGVTLQLRFVLPGGDPTAAKTSASSQPWSWDLVPTAGSAQTLVLVDNNGLRVVRIDDRRAVGAVRAGTVHVVPIARHLVLAGSRTLRWGHQPAGCLGPTTTDNSEFNVPVGTALELFAGSDTACAAPLSDPVGLTRSTAVAVIGLDAGGERANLVTLPLA